MCLRWACCLKQMWICQAFIIEVKPTLENQRLPASLSLQLKLHSFKPVMTLKIIAYSSWIPRNINKQCLLTSNCLFQTARTLWSNTSRVRFKIKPESNQEALTFPCHFQQMKRAAIWWAKWWIKDRVRGSSYRGKIILRKLQLRSILMTWTARRLIW